MIFRTFRTFLRFSVAVGFVLAALGVLSAAKEPNAVDLYDRSRVGPLADGRVIVPTNQILSPAGRQVIVSGRPTDVALSPNKRWLAVLNINEVQIVNIESGKIVSHLGLKGGSYKGILFAPNGKRVFASSMKGGIGVFQVSDRGQLAAAKPIQLSVESRRQGRSTAKRRNLADDESYTSRAATTKDALPVGLAISADGKTLFAALNLKNTLAEIDVASKKIRREIPVGNAPYDVVLVGDTAYVSNWAGRLPTRDSTTGPSGVGAPVRVDPVRNIANDGSVSVVDLKSGRAIEQIVVGWHPSGLVATPDGKFVAVANASSDTISIIDTHEHRVVETVSTKPAEKLPFGSAPNALAVSADGRRLFASNGTNNSIAVIDLAPPHSKLLGCVPTGWYPAGLVVDDKRARCTSPT